MSQGPGWITKAQAAAVLGVDVRTIERRARAGRISARAKPGFPTLYSAADVEMLAQTTAQEVRSGIVDAVPAAPANGRGAVAALRRRSSFEALGVEVLHAVRAALTHDGATGPTSPTTGPTGPTAAYVAKAEALAIAGVSDTELRRAVRAAEVKVRGRRYRRKDLEQL